jgi:hypothetical protein
MKVFISWSGERSKHIATALRGWLPKVIQALEPWMSSEDIESGMRWSTEIAGELEGTNIGIICITPENQNNPWILFEAGALSKTLKQSYVCPYLFGIEAPQLSGPISQFQSRNADKDGTMKILSTINNALGRKGLGNEELEEIFEVWWAKLYDQLNQISTYNGEKIKARTTEDILSEIVENTREQLRREEVRLLMSSEMNEKIDKFITLFDKLKNVMVPIVEQTPMLLRKSHDPLEINLSPEDNFTSEDVEILLKNMKDVRSLDKKFIKELLNPQQEEE